MRENLFHKMILRKVIFMCTALTYKTKDFYFGRTMDMYFSYDQKIIITPKNYLFTYHNGMKQYHHYAMIGIAIERKNYPLYFDAVNEKGLGMAGLNFPNNAYYLANIKDKTNLSPYEFIPFILSQCASVAEAKNILQNINLSPIPFSDQLSLTPLHWMLADEKESIVIEPMKDGIQIYDNPVGVLTNNPPFHLQLFYLNNFMNLSTKEPQNHFCSSLKLDTYSHGMGALGLPGDLSSSSRFVRAAFTKMNSISGESEKESVSQFFHILTSVSQQKGCVRLKDDELEMTIYISCCNAQKGIYYYTTYDNRQISAVDMYKENLFSDTLIFYPMIQEQQIFLQN